MRVKMKKKKAASTSAYLMLFTIFLIGGILSMYMIQMLKLMVHQRDVDDALSSATLSALVIDEKEYFKSYVSGNKELRIRDCNESNRIYKECMGYAMENVKDFYYNFKFDRFIIYEVRGNQVYVYEYTNGGASPAKSIKTKGVAKTPKGKVIEKTSAYASVSFDIKSVISKTMIRKSRDCYCTLEFN